MPIKDPIFKWHQQYFQFRCMPNVSINSVPFFAFCKYKYKLKRNGIQYALDIHIHINSCGTRTLEHTRILCSAFYNCKKNFFLFLVRGSFFRLLTQVRMSKSLCIISIYHKLHKQTHFQ